MFGQYKKFVLIPIALLGLGGCATTSDLDALRAEVSKANETAQSALSKADAASQEAAAASLKADEAKAMAAETDSKIDRMFKKSMYK
jgi:murein lipoprotein